MAYAFMHNERAHHSVTRMARVLEVSTSGFYEWRRAAPTSRRVEDARLRAEVKAIFHQHKGRYGSPRIHRELQRQDVHASRRRVVRLMHAEGLSASPKRRFRRTTDSSRTKRIAPNLLQRNFKTSAPDQAWVADVTYVPTCKGWLFLALVVDLYSRRVVGWSMSSTLDADLVCAALRQAIALRQPPRGLIMHTDRDCRYASDAYLRLIDANGIRASMSRKADCWDNAVAESTFATFEKELFRDTPYVDHEHARAAIADYIDGYYNSHRLHSTLDYVSPINYELGIK